ncbi:putative long chain polyunsaturated fatty acid elongation enzyme [Plasmodium gaboni]|uniref:Elongation of fatty acids protein n=1 Tax=Plasmodium gaboni TaxID=647221 RepID=A0A151LRD3_9APIC|nr:putative long chain polyunsaturated fatty acid elongation enzyme [Plasmodium gaboni]KYO01753.1 putative long chain polyunsaturated fatty acid elongation enzyme [Plasmodium gaboni]SOV12183.1 long chain polyunsaturated fatty acid elongation enzyme, putative [Plasmodium gaboni]SOV21569.1 long chain polyunsaturated fatty acid elongation enzyme, putative [Plasmodium sp. DRC-Itaito]
MSSINILFFNNLGESILTFFNPSLKYARSITKNWLLMNPTPFFIVLLSYFLFVFISYIYYLRYGRGTNDKTLAAKIAPSITRGPKMTRLEQMVEKLTPYYNLLQVLFSLIITLLTVYEAKNRRFSLFYNSVDFSKKNIALCCWLFYLNKLVDFVDTILIVLRKKWNQFTFLHVYHHFSVFLIMWINTSVGYDGDIYYIIVVNSFVHFIMYLYYYLASVKFKVPIFAKACVTYLQMLQFLSIILPGFYVLFVRHYCPYPRRLVGLSFCYCITLLVLFTNFALHTYIKPKKKTS